jgi:exo-poly-alpha-galacturonosidase
MKNSIMSSLLITCILIFAFSPLLSSAQGNNPLIIKNLEAPVLGTTSSSVILIWDDNFEPDYQAFESGSRSREYSIYQDGAKVGSTNKRTFTIKQLTPAKNYTFSVRPTVTSEMSMVDNSIQVTTKSAGNVFNVRRYGATGDGNITDTKAIQKAINKCSKGGIVLIPAGHYLVDHIELKSDITLELAKDAVLSFIGYNQGGNYPTDKAILTGPDGEINYESLSLITGLNVHNVIVKGEGTIDGNGETWWPHYKETLRPFTVEFIQSSNILVEGVTIIDPPVWNNHLVYVDDAIYSDVKFFKVSKEAGVNGDGLNPDASRNILIVGCLFGNQDDAIAIKSGRYDTDGNKRRRSSEHITIRDCVFDGNAAPASSPLGIAIGSELCGGVRHVVIQNCEFINAASLVNIKANRQRSFTFVDDIRIENITYTNTKEVDRWWNRAPISVDLFYGAPAGSNPSVPENLTPKTPVFRNIHFKNILIYNPVGRGIYISSFPESPVHDITFDKVYVRSRDGVTIQNVDTLTIKGISVIPIKD